MFDSRRSWIALERYLTTQTSDGCLFHQRTNVSQNRCLCAQKICITLGIFAEHARRSANRTASRTIFVGRVGIVYDFVDFQITQCVCAKYRTRTVRLTEMTQSNHSIHCNIEVNIFRGGLGSVSKKSDENGHEMKTTFLRDLYLFYYCFDCHRRICNRNFLGTGYCTDR